MEPKDNDKEQGFKDPAKIGEITAQKRPSKSEVQPRESQSAGCEKTEAGARTEEFPSHADQYKMLREEIMQYSADMGRTQLWAGIGAASVYTWLLLHPKEVSSGVPHYSWFIGPVIILICALRSLNLLVRIGSIAKYLKRIESTAFDQNSTLPGWENYKTTDRWIDKWGNFVGAGVWVLGFLGSLVLSWLLSR